MRGLLLAEKPSVMVAIREVYKKERSFPHQLEFGAFHGHLMELKTPGEYEPAWEDRSNAANLPMIPSTFSYKPNDEKSVGDLCMLSFPDDGDLADLGGEDEMEFTPPPEPAGASGDDYFDSPELYSDRGRDDIPIDWSSPSELCDTDGQNRNRADNIFDGPGRKSCVKGDKRQSRKRKQIEGLPEQGKGQLNLASPPVFRDGRRYACVA